MPLPDPASRYAGAREILVPGPGGVPQRMLAPRIALRPRTRGRFHVPPGTRLDLLGATAAGDSTRWWLIADANPFVDPAELETPGRVIEIPDA